MRVTVVEVVVGGRQISVERVEVARLLDAVPRSESRPLHRERALRERAEAAHGGSGEESGEVERSEPAAGAAMMAVRSTAPVA